MVAYTTTTNGDRIAARRMMDYKEFYECEMKRADKAEDELAAAQARIAELEAQVAELEAHAERNQGSADVLDEIEELMFGWEDDD